MLSSYFALLPGHDLAYNEVVKPTRRWAFSYYFLYRWLPLLHPQQAMLIQVLRQSTWQQGRPTGRCQLANATLCRLMGWAESSHKTLLAELERPLSAWFIERERTRKRHATEGHAVEGAPRYRVAMDEPLTPRDQAALGALLRAQRPATPYAAAEALMALAGQRSRDLWAALDAQEVEALPTMPATVADIVARGWPHLDLTTSRPVAEAAEQLQLRLTGAGYAHLELDYFLRAWLPVLGVNQAWLVIALRARCFHDPATGETRDVVVLQRRELEAQLGLPERTFRRLLREEGSLSLFGISAADAPLDATERRVIPARGALAFHVAYPLLPIAPPDRDRYEALLLGRREATLSTSGHATPLEAATPPTSSPRVIPDRPSNPSRGGHPTPLIEWAAAIEPVSERPHNPSDIGKSGQLTLLDAASQPNIPSALENKELTPLKSPESPLPLGRGRRDEIQALLAPFQIQGMARILANPSLTVADIRGWILRGKEEVEPNKMGGYLFRRLSDPSIGESDPLPARYRLAGSVTEGEAARFEEWWLAEARPPFDDSAQRERYGAWLQVVKQEAGSPDRPDYSPHACWRRELARSNGD